MPCVIIRTRLKPFLHPIQLVQLSAQAYFIGDIAPELSTLSNGEVIVNGVKRKIYQGEKARNPDGTINYTRLDLI
jgi:hypothetical protein